MHRATPSIGEYGEEQAMSRKAFEERTRVPAGARLHVPASAHLQVPAGVRLASDDFGGMIMQLGEPVGSGIMRTQPITSSFLAATVDFSCERCPSIAEPPEMAAAQGRWFSINYCAEGRCEVALPDVGCAVVKAGDCCVSGTDYRPKDFRYPLGSYRGIELWVNTAISTDPSFFLLAEAGVSLDALAQDAGVAAVFSGDEELNGPLRRIGAAISQLHVQERCTSAEQRAASIGFISAQCKNELIGLLLTLSQRDMAASQPAALLTPAQMNLAQTVAEEVQTAPAEAHDARTIARRYGISAATLNTWFSNLYGMTVAAYVRRERMMKAASLLERGARVADVAVSVGYANPSKFAAAFKRERGTSPSDYRRCNPQS